MKTVGIIVEYNPFHNGHLYQLQKAKKITEADVVICIMSGNFLQRGEPAIVSKWARTRMALSAGADLVIELPYVFSVQKAEFFAYGAVYLLNALQCNYVCFGSESGHIEDFQRTIQYLNKYRTLYESRIREYIEAGTSYPSALGQAFQSLPPEENLIDLSTPNNILGFHYMEAAASLKTDLQFITVKRKNAGYHDPAVNTTNIASATSIRNLFQDTGHIESIKKYMPPTSYNELTSYIANFGHLHSWSHYWNFLQFQIISKNRDELRTIYEMEEGLENRFIRAAQTSKNFPEFMKTVKTKRYTWTRLQRICTQILLNIHKDTIQSFQNTPQYIRLLGISQQGKNYLKSVKKDLEIPLISKVSAEKNAMLDIDIKATRIYALGLAEPYRSNLCNLDYQQPPIII